MILFLLLTILPVLLHVLIHVLPGVLLPLVAVLRLLPDAKPVMAGGGSGSRGARRSAGRHGAGGAGGGARGSASAAPRAGTRRCGRLLDGSLGRVGSDCLKQLAPQPVVVVGEGLGAIHLQRAVAGKRGAGQAVGGLSGAEGVNLGI
jgi:hypothetical protein